MSSSSHKLAQNNIQHVITAVFLFAILFVGTYNVVQSVIVAHTNPMSVLAAVATGFDHKLAPFYTVTIENPNDTVIIPFNISRIAGTERAILTAKRKTIWSDTEGVTCDSNNCSNGWVFRWEPTTQNTCKLTVKGGSCHRFDLDTGTYLDPRQEIALQVRAPRSAVPDTLRIRVGVSNDVNSIEKTRVITVSYTPNASIFGTISAPTTIKSGTAPRIQWNTEGGATHCRVLQKDKGWLTKWVAPAGDTNPGALYEDQTFKLFCRKGSSGTGKLIDTTEVTIASESPTPELIPDPISSPAPSPTDISVDLIIDGSSGPLTREVGNAIFSWNSSNADYCTASGGTFWSGSKPTVGTETVWIGGEGIDGATYSITCSASSGDISPTSDSVIVSFAEITPEPSTPTPGLTEAQIQAILAILRSFDAGDDIVDSVQRSLYSSIIGEPKISDESQSLYRSLTQPTRMSVWYPSLTDESRQAAVDVPREFIASLHYSPSQTVDISRVKFNFTFDSREGAPVPAIAGAVLLDQGGQVLAGPLDSVENLDGTVSLTFTDTFTAGAGTHTLTLLGRYSRQFDPDTDTVMILTNPHKDWEMTSRDGRVVEKPDRTFGFFQTFYDSSEPPSATDITVTKSQLIEDQDVLQGVLYQMLGGIQISVPQNAVIKEMNLTALFGAKGGAPLHALTNIQLYNDEGRVVSTSLDLESDGISQIIRFSDSMYLEAGKHDLTLKAKYSPYFSDGDTINVFTKPSTDWVIYSEGSGRLLSATDAYVHLSQMTVKKGQLTIYASSQPISQTVIAGAQSFEFVRYILDASQSIEGVRLVTLPLAVGGSGGARATNLTNCQLYDGSTSVTSGSNVVNPTSFSSSTTFTFDGTGLVVAKGTSKTLSLKCNISASASGAISWGIDGSQQATYVGASGILSGTTIDEILVESSGPVTTVASGGSLHVTLGASSPGYRMVSSGTQNVELVRIKFSAVSEAIDVRQVALQLSDGDKSTPYDLVGRKVTLHDVFGAQVGEAVFATGDFATSSAISDFRVQAEGSAVLVVKGDIADISEIGTLARSGDHLKVDYDGDNKGISGTYGIGVSSGRVRIPVPASIDTASQGVLIVE